MTTLKVTKKKAVEQSVEQEARACPAGRGRRAGAHAVSGGPRTNPAEIVHGTKRARHAAQKHKRPAKVRRASRGPLATPWIPRMPYPSRPAELVDFGIGPDVSARQLMIRATQTRAFGATVIVGLALTWLGAVVPSYLDGASSPPLSTRESASDDPTPTASPFSLKEQASHGTPWIDGAAPPVSIDPTAFAQLEMALANLDQDADGSEVLAPQQPLPAATCEPTCTESAPTEPLPEDDIPPELAQELNPPPASETVDQSTPSPGEQTPLAPTPTTSSTDPTVVPPAEQAPLVPLPNAPPTGPAVVPPAAQTLGPPPGPS
jgi:hypothetical protein